MAHCSKCNAEVVGRFCTACGKDSAEPQGATIEVAACNVTASGAAAQPALAREPGYVAPVAGVPVQSMGSTADNRFTHDAEFLLRNTGERIAWQGKPSIVSIAPRVIVWAVLLVFALMLAAAIHHGGFILPLMLIAALHTGAGYLNWRHTTYRITSQRLEYSSGVFSCTTAASPLNRIGNVTILRPFPWNILGLGHLELDIPDEARARNRVRRRVLLHCLQNLETTRDLIHSSSAITNQLWDAHRYGR